MKKVDRDERDNFRSILEKEMLVIGSTDVWDAVVSVFSKYTEPYLLYLKADLPIIEKLADGFSVASVANFFAISSKDVYEVAEIWGIMPLEFTLDFNPLLVYNRGMTLESFLAEINEYLPIPLKRETAVISLVNVKRYYEILDFLKEEENG